MPGQTMFLQQTTMGFDGSSVVSLPANSHPSLVTDLTIFATVCQDIGNDGYVVGKGVNDRMRDFGLYLRSSKRTIWLAYGAEGNTPGFREILFFYDVSVADGSCHTVSAVVDSASNRAVLYIDGKAVGLRSPLPSFPEFRPGVSKDMTQGLDVQFSLHIANPEHFLTPSSIVQHAVCGRSTQYSIVPLQRFHQQPVCQHSSPLSR